VTLPSNGRPRVVPVARAADAAATPSPDARVPVVSPVVAPPVVAPPVVATPIVSPVASTPAVAAPAVPAGGQESADEEVRRVNHLVDELRRHWTRTGADIAGRLRPGVDEAALDAAEHRLGLPVPRGARAWWRRVDGVDPYRSSRYRAQAPTVGPGGWVPLRLADALERTGSSVVGAPAPPGLLPLFARDEELIAVRLGSGPARVEQLVLADDGESYQHAWRVGLEELLGTWADSLLAAVHWLPDAHDWVVDPFALRAMRNAHLLD